MSQPSPPPPYTTRPPKPEPTLTCMPFDVLDRIFFFLVASYPSPSLRALTRWTLVRETRLVSKLVYTVIQTQLRTLLLAYYLADIRPPFSSAFLPLASSPTKELYIALADCSLKETQVLDLYIAAATREKAEGIQSGLHEEMNWRNDLFLVNQPSARLSDLLVSSSITPALPFPISDLSVSFTPRRLTLYCVRSQGGKRTELLKLERQKGEKEDATVLRLISALKDLRGFGGLLVEL